ncbi:MAG: endolytic transglycosylase MltG [Lachnospiraceae bacterium]|nr:endolytic transglycosylase MltG [Lachnospiraceae bacterium]
MKLKYFLRGVGVGIIFGALIMLVAYLTSGAGKLSDKEIIERAENLGMVKEENLVVIGDGSEDKSTEQSDLTTEDAVEATTEQATTEQAKVDTTEEGTTQEIIQGSDVSIEEVVDESINPTTEDSTTQSADSTYVTAKISVTSGMTSTEIAMLLQDAGIIDDYLDFDEFLNVNGYSTQLKINDYEFNSNMTYEELAKELIKEDKVQ